MNINQQVNYCLSNLLLIFIWPQMVGNRNTLNYKSNFDYKYFAQIYKRKISDKKSAL